MSAAEIVTQTIAPDWDAYADKLAAGGDSVLAKLRQTELSQALEAIRSNNVRNRRAVTEPIDVFWFEPRV